MGYEIVIADPAKNITVLTLTPVPPEERARVAGALLNDPSLKAEQVGFVIPPPHGAPLWRGSTLWSLEMMGGEFCGNAARSFGLYVARRTGLAGKAGSAGHVEAEAASGVAAEFAARHFQAPQRGATP
jgi:diaminopimelate epimerase